MSEEMRNRRMISKLNLGRHRPGLRPARALAAHVAWAARIADKFAARPAMRGFSRARLTDLATPGSTAHNHWLVQWIAHFEQRPWVRHVFRSEVRQQLVMGRTMPWKPGSEPPARASSMAVQRTAMPGRGFAAATLRPGSGADRPLLLQKASLPRMATPLTIAAARTQAHPGRTLPPRIRHERVDAGAPQIARRYQRIELRREPVTTALLSPSPPAPSQPGWPVAERSRATMTPRFAQPPAPAESSRPHRAINVTQVADEVIKQLDRRLVTARERMGKI